MGPLGFVFAANYLLCSLVTKSIMSFVTRSHKYYKAMREKADLLVISTTIIGRESVSPISNPSRTAEPQSSVPTHLSPPTGYSAGLPPT